MLYICCMRNKPSSLLCWVSHYSYPPSLKVEVYKMLAIGFANLSRGLEQTLRRHYALQISIIYTPPRTSDDQIEQPLCDWGYASSITPPSSSYHGFLEEYRKQRQEPREAEPGGSQRWRRGRDHGKDQRCSWWWRIWREKRG